MKPWFKDIITFWTILVICFYLFCCYLFVLFLFLHDMKKINLLLLKVNFLFVCLTLEVYYYRKELDTILKYLIEKKGLLFGGRETKGLRTKQWLCVMMVDMSQLLMWLFLGNKSNHGFLTPFSWVKKREELLTRVFILLGWSLEMTESAIAFRMRFLRKG